jgi:hypothetical protein
MLLATCAAAFASCLIYDEDLLEDDDGEGGGAGGGTGGDGGRTSECEAPEHCPGDDTTCAFRTCEQGTCGVGHAPAETPCTETNGQLCDGMGSCVECLTEAQCSGGAICNAGSCVPPGSLPLGAPCTSGGACQSNQCIDGVCCESACTGFCAACNLGGTAGSCVHIGDGLDPDNECSGADSCNGVGACQCGDGLKNGSESDLDCGGACTPCLFGDDCSAPGDCASMNCQAGTCGALCGDMKVEGNEQCDDGNTNPYDACSPLCLFPVGHLIISELAVAPNEAEMVEIYNPTNAPVSLSTVYLADFNTYWQVTTGVTPVSSDFLVQFPSGATIAPGAFVVVSLRSATEFASAYGVAPNYDLAPGDAGAPAMSGLFTSNTSLTNTSEMVVLFSWNGSSNLVTDLDYLFYGTTSSNAADKTGVVVNGSAYAPDTAVATQATKTVTAPAGGSSLHRCDTAESTETKSGGNGSSGHDETSESFTAAWKSSGTRTPGGPPPVNLCP